MSRAIDATLDPQALQGLAKQLLQAWHSQKAATQWVMRQQLGSSQAFSGGTELNPTLLDSLRPAPGHQTPGGQSPDVL
jgi:hypothetical protein